MSEPATVEVPNNVDVEQALLGAILINGEAFYRVSEFLSAEDFFEPVHREIFVIMGKLLRVGKAVTVASVKTFLPPEFVEGMTMGQYLARLATEATTVLNAYDYGRTIRDLAMRRSLFVISQGIGDAALNARVEDTPAVQIEEAERALYELAERGSSSAGFQPFNVIVKSAVERAAAAFQREGMLSGLATGLYDLDRLMGGLQPSDLVIIAARPAMGKAQPLDAKVLSTSGWKTMGEVRLGDELASVDGTRSLVSGIFPQGERQVYRVTFSDGRSARACGEHLWHIESSKFAGAKIVSTDEISQMLGTERYRRRIYVPLVSGDFGTRGDHVVDPWVLGVMLGNGNLTNICPMVSTADAATLYRMQASLGERQLLKASGDYDYRISGVGGINDLTTGLRELGLMGLRSEEKHVPTSYLDADRHTRIELLRGLMDTDGWVETFGAVRYSTSSEQLAKDVQYLVRSLGGICTISHKTPVFHHKGERREGLRHFICNIRHAEAQSLMTLKRKSRRCEDRKHPPRLTIISIEPDGVDRVQCIAVTHPSHLYVTDDFIVTHNTALATNIAFHVARTFRPWQLTDGTMTPADGGRVAFFSLEMSSEQLATRILAEQAGIPSSLIRRGEIAEHQFSRIIDVSNLMSAVPLYVDDSGGISIAQVVSKARRLKRQKGIDLIVVDYLQLLSAPGRRGDGRVQEVTEITTGLKALAKELSIPVIALSQLSRQVEAREDKHPLLSDLRESGSIEQDADVVLFLYREEYYLANKEPPEDKADEHLKWQAAMEKAHGRAEIIIGKQRHGPTGTVQVQFNSGLTKFSNLARADYLPERHE